MIVKTEDIIPIIPQNSGNCADNRRESAGRSLLRLSKHGGPTAADRHTFNRGGGLKQDAHPTRCSRGRTRKNGVCENTHDDKEETLNLHLVRLDFKGDSVFLIMYTEGKKNASLVTEDESEHLYKYEKNIIYNPKFCLKIIPVA